MKEEQIINGMAELFARGLNYKAPAVRLPFNRLVKFEDYNKSKIKGLTWYKDIVNKLNPTIISYNGYIFIYGLRVTYNNIFRFEYVPYAVCKGSLKGLKVESDKKKDKVKLLNNTLKNSAKCYYCGKFINLKIKDSYMVNEYKRLLCDVCGVLNE